MYSFKEREPLKVKGFYTVEQNNGVKQLAGMSLISANHEVMPCMYTICVWQ